MIRNLDFILNAMGINGRLYFRECHVLIHVFEDKFDSCMANELLLGREQGNQLRKFL